LQYPCQRTAGAQSQSPSLVHFRTIVLSEIHVGFYKCVTCVSNRHPCIDLLYVIILLCVLWLKEKVVFTLCFYKGKHVVYCSVHLGWFWKVQEGCSVSVLHVSVQYRVEAPMLLSSSELVIVMACMCIIYSVCKLGYQAVRIYADLFFIDIL
jgi:hypothetical protein